MSKSFAAFDIDGTFIRWQLYHALVDKLFELKFISYPHLDKVDKTQHNWRIRSNVDSFNIYQKALIKAFDSSMANLEVAKFQLAADLVFEEYKDQVYTYTRNLFNDFKKSGYILFAVSGSPEIIIKKMAKYYGFDDYASPTYEVKQGVLSGKKDISALNKLRALTKLVTRHKLSWQKSYAVGDSEGDISMLNKVSNPIVFNPSKQLYAHAATKKWPIVIERKNMVYKLEYIEGDYRLTYDL